MYTACDSVIPLQEEKKENNPGEKTEEGADRVVQAGLHNNVTAETASRKESNTLPHCDL